MSKYAENVANLRNAVAIQATVVASAIALIIGIAEKYKQATANLADQGADTSELVDITNQITSESNALAEAIKANTPSETEPAPSEQDVTTAANAGIEAAAPVADVFQETTDTSTTTETVTE